MSISDVIFISPFFKAGNINKRFYQPSLKTSISEYTLVNICSRQAGDESVAGTLTITA
jgi:hypothetical protein